MGGCGNIRNMYELYDYNYENYEEPNKGQGEGDPNNGMKEIKKDLDEKHTSTNQNEKKTQDLIKILIAVIIIFIILLFVIGIFIAYTYIVKNPSTPTPSTTKLTLTTKAATLPITTSWPPGKHIAKPIPITHRRN